MWDSALFTSGLLNISLIWLSDDHVPNLYNMSDNNGNNNLEVFNLVDELLLLENLNQ